MPYTPAPTRYDNGAKIFKRCGRSGLVLSRLALGYWHNFGAGSSYETARAMTLRAFDLGITHHDLANNYGPPAGSAEVTFGRILSEDLAAYRDELIITTKAGYDMWPGPYGDFGSRKYLIASLDQSLQRMGLDYVDIFYHHRPDPQTPLEETMGALATAVHSGKALYVGLSNYYEGALAERAIAILRDLGVPCLIHQHKYNMLERTPETTLFPTLRANQIGGIAFSPLAQGVLTERYLSGVIAEDSRVKKMPGYISDDKLSDKSLARIRKLGDFAKQRGQTISQLALAWTMRAPGNEFVIIGASRVSQIDDNAAAINNLDFSAEEVAQIDAILAG